ncbi:lipid IV(A) 3-deoxy-D-manno-octulosonic acid transferase [Neisseria sp. Ec49-e6-T10]|uniref:lipid IV(A) 3-deoxy-D-manno-octulosonic acid transferase n=1 Tax=Neisseria sp. Ec49-e6-T10 TaxID=3140744 RepID=UPI003EBCAC71
MMTLTQKLTLAFYQFLWLFAPFFIRFYLKKRAKKAPDYLLNWAERFGQPLAHPVSRPIWIHAVSVGETRAAQPLIKALQQEFPDVPFLITQMTPTGRKTAQQLYPTAQIRYLPYDKKDYIDVFLQEHKPWFGVLMETELWPNLVHQSIKQNIPLFLANARLSEKSFQGYKKVHTLIEPIVSQLKLICAQSEADANRFSKLGAKSVEVCGNSKYDMAIPESMYKLSEVFTQYIGERPVVVCASTREGEEALLLDAWHKNETDALLVMIPRHPERFNEVYQLAQSKGFTVQKRSENSPVLHSTNIWVGDSMGELFAYYLCATVAFVGGSLVDVGGQNIIEPMQCAKPTLFGFSTYNFSQVCADALVNKAAIQVYTANEWLEQTQKLLNQLEYCQQLGQQALLFTEQFQGATKRMAQLIKANIS